MIKISAVSYLNTKPFLRGLLASPIKNICVDIDIPSECARKLIENEVDLGLIPIAVIPLVKDAQILPGYCIAADGCVESVKLYSQVPLNEIKTILLDYQSRTSIILVKILADELWHISPEWVETNEGYEKQISRDTAAVIIGDRTFTLNACLPKRVGAFPFEFDLAEEWKKLTGLPFVFACWVSNKPLSDEFLNDFAKAMEYGINNIGETAAREAPSYFPFNIENYLLNSLKLRLDERGTKAITLFLEKMKNYTTKPKFESH